MGEQLLLIEQEGPTTQKEAFIYYVEEMDLEMIEALLEKERYMNVDKDLFMHKLSVVFDTMRNMGDSSIKAQPGTCAGKYCDHIFERGFDFVGNKSGFRFSLVISGANGKIDDISECMRFINPKIPFYDTKKLMLSYIR